jgi:SAF domain
MHRTHPQLWRARTIDWRRLTALLMALLALLIGALAWVGYSSSARTEPLIIAARPIPPGTRLTADMLTTIQAPLTRPAALQGLADPASLIGTYTRVALSPDQIVRPELVQAQPLDQHIFTNDPLPAETLTMDVFELSLTGIASVHAQDRLNILVLVDTEHGADATFSIGQMDAPGSGARVVRVLTNLNVLHVDNTAAYLEVTHAQSQYLWALAAAKTPFVGEIATTPDAPIGPLRPQDASAGFLGMDGAPSQPPSATPTAAPAGRP